MMIFILFCLITLSMLIAIVKSEFRNVCMVVALLLAAVGIFLSVRFL